VSALRVVVFGNVVLLQDPPLITPPGVELIVTGDAERDYHFPGTPRYYHASANSLYRASRLTQDNTDAVIVQHNLGNGVFIAAQICAALWPVTIISYNTAPRETSKYHKMPGIEHFAGLFPENGEPGIPEFLAQIAAGTIPTT
jgi:hypothetical protein